MKPRPRGLCPVNSSGDHAPPAATRLTEEAIPWHHNQPKQQDMLTDDAFDRVEALEQFAAERGISLLEVALGGLVAQPGGGAARAGASRPEQVHSNAKGVSWVPSPDDLAA